MLPAFDNIVSLPCTDPAAAARTQATVGDRLRTAAKLFSFFVNLRKHDGLDVAAFHILQAFNLACLAEQQRLFGPSATFGDLPFDAILTATALSDMTGIPRQTVRRRLAILERLGYLSQTDDGSYRMCKHLEQLDLVEHIGGSHVR